MLSTFWVSPGWWHWVANKQFCSVHSACHMDASWFYSLGLYKKCTTSCVNMISIINALSGNIERKQTKVFLHNKFCVKHVCVLFFLTYTYWCDFCYRPSVVWSVLFTFPLLTGECCTILGLFISACSSMPLPSIFWVQPSRYTMETQRFTCYWQVIYTEHHITAVHAYYVPDILL